MLKDEIREYMETSASFNIQHVYPIASQEEFWQRVNQSSHYESYIEGIRQEGQRLVKESIVETTYQLFSMFSRDGTRIPFEKVYFEKRRRLNTMALMSLLEPHNEVYRDALHEILWSICNEYSWCLPAHLKNALETDGAYEASLTNPEWSRQEIRTEIDLFAAETGFALSEIMRLTDKHLPDLLRSRIKEEIRRRLFKPFLLQGPYKWETANHNWAAVCAGSIGAAALLLLEDTEQLTLITDKVLSSLTCYLAGFGEDGACLEGLGYWNYGFGYYVYYADLLKRRTQGAMDLFLNDKAHQIALFQQKCYLIGDLNVNFSDSTLHTPVQIGLTHYLAQIYPDLEVPSIELNAPYKEDHCSRFAPALRNLIWFDPHKSGGAWASAAYYLANAEWFVSRHMALGEGYGLAAKGGNNDEPHNHNDIGSFILTHNGHAFIAELGSGEYTDDYFHAGRYRYACNGSQGHSVPIINGLYQVEGMASHAEILQVSKGEQEDTFELDIAKAYQQPHLIGLKRRFTWLKQARPLLHIESTFEFTELPSQVVDRFVTTIEPNINIEGNNYVMLQHSNQSRLIIMYDPLQVKLTVESRAYRNHYGQDTAWFTLDFSILNLQLICTNRIQFQFL
jgi:hypothetical protein